MLKTIGSTEYSDEDLVVDKDETEKVMKTDLENLKAVLKKKMKRC